MNQQSLPGADTVLLMGIISFIVLPLSCFYPYITPLSIVSGLITLVQAKKARKLYQQHPERYTDYDHVETGRVLAYIGMAFTVILLLYMAFYFWSFNRTYQ